MKKIFFFAALALSTVFAACSKDEAGGTSTQSMAGQWYVTVDAVDDNGTPIEYGEDYFGKGQTILLTYNTAANNATEMWIDDLGEYNRTADYGAYYPDYIFPNYSIKSKVKIDLTTLSFSSTDAANIADPGIIANDDNIVYSMDAMPVTIEGKILKGAGHQKNGSPADSIVMFVTYKDDPWYPGDGYAKYKISGVRYSGLVEND